jgi:hypothetical protein
MFEMICESAKSVSVRESERESDWRLIEIDADLIATSNGQAETARATRQMSRTRGLSLEAQPGDASGLRPSPYLSSLSLPICLLPFANRLAKRPRTQVEECRA